MLDLGDAYRAAHDGGVWVARPRALRLLRLTGPQRVWFLQNTITADVDDVPDRRVVESCFLDPKGRIVAHFRAGFAGEEVWIDADPACASALAEWFVKYRFRTKVEVETVDRPLTTIFGPPVVDGSITVTTEAVSFGRDLAGVPAADVHGHADTAGLPQGPSELYDALRIEAGVGEFGVDFGPHDLPLEAGLTRVVSVSKGCYVGQETIARIHFRGHVNRVLRTLAFTGVAPSAGARLSYEGKPAGTVTSAIASPRPLGLGMVRVEPPEGAVLAVEGGGDARVGPIPEGTKVKS